MRIPSHSLTPVAVAALGLLWACSQTPQSESADEVAAASQWRAEELRASVYSPSTQAHASVAADSQGRLITAWDSRRQEGGTYGVFARLFDPLGRPLSHEVHVNRSLLGMQRKPAVVSAADGAVWFAWESTGQDGSGSAVVARRFSADLRSSGPEIAVNQKRDGDQAEVTLAAGMSGGVVAAFTSVTLKEDGSAYSSIHARLLGVEGRAQVEVAASADGRDSLPKITALQDGRYLVAWARSAGPLEHEGGVYARFLDAKGLVLGEEFLLDGSVDGIEPSVDALAGGGFLAAWMQQQAEGYAVKCRSFDAAGTPRGEVIQVATAEHAWNSAVEVAAGGEDHFLVAFNQQHAEHDSVQMRIYDREGDLVSAEQATRHEEGSQQLDMGGGRHALWTGQGQLALAWAGDGGFGDSSAVHLSLRLPFDLIAPQPPALGVAQPFSADLSAAELAAIPPIYDPNWVPQDRLVGLAAAGGDFGFEAVPGTGWTPPDPEAAVGPDRIVVMTNGRIATFDKNGNQQWFDEIENSFGFWGNLGANNFVFDPEVKWDPHAQRFFAMASERSNNNRSYFLFAVSKDATPDTADDWHKYRLDVTALAGNDIDSPNMSVSTDYVLLTADFFGPDKYLIYVIDKSSVLGGGAPSVTSELISGARQQSMGVPVVYSNDATLYILQSTEFSTNTQVIFHAITDPFTAYSRTTFTHTVDAYTYPNQPPQRGSSSRPFLFEPRFWSVAESNNSIWAVHHVNNTKARVRWHQFDLNGWPHSGSNPTTRQSGEVNLGSGIHSFFPSIHVDSADNAAITFARSASNEYISMGRATRGASDPLNTFRPAQVVQVSNNAHTSGRWGDYSGTQLDPAQPGSFWGHHEFTNGSTSSWRTWVARYDMRAAPFVLDETPLTAGSPVTLMAHGADPGTTVYFVYGLSNTGLTTVPQLNTTLSLDAPVLLGSAAADAAGDASLTRNVPNGAAGLTVWLQALQNRHVTDWYKVDVN